VQLQAWIDEFSLVVFCISGGFGKFGGKYTRDLMEWDTRKRRERILIDVQFKLFSIMTGRKLNAIGQG
jgi:hypothetical protein